MNTLDEVIATMEHPLYGADDGFAEIAEDDIADALNYLRAYRDDRNDLTALRAFWAEQQANPPLTWDELRQMEGKPVWVEWSEEIIGDYFQFHAWFLVEWINDNEDEIIMQNKYGKRMIRHKNDNDWQAYRKERE